MTIVEYAEKELESLSNNITDKTDLNKIKPLIISTLRELSEMEDSSSIISFINIFDNLVKYVPLTPLTGEEDEWGEVKKAGFTYYQQNKRCARVFRNNANNKEVYIIDGIIFSDNGGKSWFQCKESKYKIDTFPFDMTKFRQKRIILNKSHEDVSVKEQMENGQYEVV